MRAEKIPWASSPPASPAFRRVLGALLVVGLVGMLGALSVALVPRLLGYGTLAISRSDTEGPFPPGSLVLSRWKPATEVKPGDVLLIRREGEQTSSPLPIAYEVVALKKSGGQTLLWARRDASGSVNTVPYVLPDRVVAPAHTVPYLGYVIAPLQNPRGYTLLAALPAAALCCLLLLLIWAPVPAPPAVTRGGGSEEWMPLPPEAEAVNRLLRH